jgi:ATP-dependent exoDNAse (exonuclease V) beta subunit
MHSAKGLEWPIVIPINSPAMLDDDMKFLHRRSDNTVHFKLLSEAGPHYDMVKNDERDQLRRERVRLWYVALTRACDLLLLPRQSERAPSDWFSLLEPRLGELPTFDGSMLSGGNPAAAEETENGQDEATWKAEAATIAATRRAIIWRSPSRHEGLAGAYPILPEEEIYIETAGLGEHLPVDSDPAAPSGTIQGSRERGLVLHKLLEEVLTGETTEDIGALEIRARDLLGQLDVPEADRPEDGPHAPELAATVIRALAIPEVAMLKSRLLPEKSVFSTENAGDRITYLGGVADALALGPDGRIDVVIDWKSDVDPDARQVNLYHEQVCDYLAASLAPEGLIVFVTTGRIERVRRPDGLGT